MAAWLRVVVLAVVLLVGFERRATVQMTLPAPNAWDVAVPVQADLYLLAYLILPIWILQVAGQLPARANETWLLRSGSRFRWLCDHLRWASGQAALLLVPWLAGSVASSASLPWSWAWSAGSAGATTTGDHEIAIALQTGGIGPAVAWGLQWLALWFVLLAVHTSLAVAVLLLPRTSARFLAAGTVWLALVLLIRKSESVGAGIFVYQASAAGQWPGLPVVMPAMAIGLLIGAFCFADKARPWVSEGLRTYAPVVSYGAAVLVGVVSAAINMGSQLNLGDLLTSAFYGFDDSQLNLGVYAYYVLTYSGFTLLYMVNAEQRLWPLYLLVSIRSGSPRRWMLQAWRDISVKAIALLIVLFSCCLAVVAVGGGSLTASGTALRSYCFLVNGVLQLLFVTGLILLVAFVSRSRVAVVLSIAAVIVLQTPLVNVGGTLPLGLNAMGLITTWPAALTVTAHLLTAAAGAVGLTLLACTHSLRRATERMTA